MVLFSFFKFLFRFVRYAEDETENEKCESATRQDDRAYEIIEKNICEMLGEKKKKKWYMRVRPPINVNDKNK